jgi:hypothetical protein
VANAAEAIAWVRPLITSVASIPLECEANVAQEMISAHSMAMMKMRLLFT